MDAGRFEVELLFDDVEKPVKNPKKSRESVSEFSVLQRSAADTLR